jgi:hypothetical protein
VPDKDKKYNTDLSKLAEEISKLNENYQPKKLIVKSFVNGVFQAVGATFGFAIVVLILTQVFGLLGGVPVISNFLETSGIQKIIDNQVDKIDEEEEADDAQENVEQGLDSNESVE